jgi:Spy/CpxP family protein refolding chaperone
MGRPVPTIFPYCPILGLSGSRLRAARDQIEGNMKKWQVHIAIYSVIFFVSLTLSTASQQGAAGSNPGAAAGTQSSQTSPGDKADPDTPEADDSLKLTDDQKARIKSIREDAQDQLKAMQKDKTLNDDQRQKKAKQIKMDTRKNVWSVLTAEQRTIWAEEARQRREAKSRGTPQ